MGLTNQDRKQLDLLIKATTRGISIPLDLACRMVPGQGSIEDFSYGLVSGMIIGNFLAMFASKNGREMDKDEMADLFSTIMARMPEIRKAIMKELESNR
jgi:hypothetical protein